MLHHLQVVRHLLRVGCLLQGWRELVPHQQVLRATPSGPQVGLRSIDGLSLLHGNAHSWHLKLSWLSCHSATTLRLVLPWNLPWQCGADVWLACRKKLLGHHMLQ